MTNVMSEQKRGVQKVERQDRRDPTEFFNDVGRDGVATVSSVSRTVVQTISQKMSFLQDIANVAFAALGGMITLAIFSPGRIKTGLLFYLAGAGFVFCVLAASTIRTVLLKVSEKAYRSLVELEDDIRVAVGRVKYHGTEGHHEAFHNFESVMSRKIEMPQLPWITHVYAIMAVSIVFVISLLFVGLSLLFKVSS